MTENRFAYHNVIRLLAEQHGFVEDAEHADVLYHPETRVEIVLHAVQNSEDAQKAYELICRNDAELGKTTYAVQGVFDSGFVNQGAFPGIPKQYH